MVFRNGEEEGNRNDYETVRTTSGEEINAISFNVGTELRGKDLRRSSELFFENRKECEWLSTNEAAHFLSVTPNALRILVYRGQVPVYKFGRRLRFRLKDCQALFQKKGI